jgi:hypothetical protein
VAVPKNWRFVASFLSIFSGLMVFHYVPNGWQVVPTAATVYAVYGLVQLVWRSQQHRDGGVV